MEQFAAPTRQQQQQQQQQQQACAALAAVEQLELQQQNCTIVVVGDENDNGNDNDAAPAIEATIIDIPMPAAASPPGPAATAPASSSALLCTSSSYDTDSSTTSSTCCTRHGEHIYMEKAQQQQQQQQHQQKPKHACTADAEVSYSKSEHRLHWPFFMLAISIIEVAIFAYDSATVPATATTRELIANMPIPSDSVFIYRPDRRMQVWRFLSYMFLHANWFHLGFNVVIQLFYGIPLEVMHGPARVAIIYCAGVFGGSLGTSVVDSEVYLVGASGGVYAILAAHLANLMLNYRQMRYAVAQLLSVLIFAFYLLCSALAVLCDLGYALYSQYLDPDNVSKAAPLENVWSTMDPPPVSYVAHMTGALAGFTIGLLVLKNFEHRAYENLIWWLALGVYSAFTLFAIVFNLINTITGQLVEERSEVVAQQLLYDLGVS